MARFNFDRKPIRLLLIGYISIAFIGAFLLSLPVMHTHHIDFLDAFFTAASAVSMTGLTVVNTGLDFTPLGQGLILALIQLGGLGYISIAMFIYIIMRKKISFDNKNLLKESLIYPTMDGVVGFLRKILFFVFGIELIGALLLFLKFKLNMPFEKAVWSAVFHSVSAFNNAGFSIFADGLMPYRDDLWINLIITSLILLGGLGYFVIFEIYFYTKRRFANISLHTKIVVSSTIFLSIFATLIIFSFEYNNDRTLGELGFFHKILSSYFTAINYRTAGFNTLDLGALKDASLFFGSLFMIIGGAPGGTAGGVKVTTIAVLLIYGYCSLKDSPAKIFRFEIPKDTINKAFVISICSIFYIIVCVLFLSLVETNIPFLPLLFEVSSAFATVGVSVGDGAGHALVAAMSPESKIVLMIAMFTGRVGILAFFTAIFFKDKQQNINYPKGKIIL